MSSRVKSSGRVRRYGIFKWNEKLWVLVNGHIFANSDQVGGSTSTPTNPTFSISLAICIEAVWVCFADLLQTDLDKVKESWNSHWIRTSRNATVSSILDMMYFLPKEFGQNDCLIPVSSNKLIDMEIYIYIGQEKTDPGFAECVQCVKENNDLTCPRTILEEGTLFEKLITFAMGHLLIGWATTRLYVIAH